MTNFESLVVQMQTLETFTRQSLKGKWIDSAIARLVKEGAVQIVGKEKGDGKPRKVFKFIGRQPKVVTVDTSCNAWAEVYPEYFTLPKLEGKFKRVTRWTE